MGNGPIKGKTVGIVVLGTYTCYRRLGLIYVVFVGVSVGLEFPERMSGQRESWREPEAWLVGLVKLSYVIL